MAGFFDAFRTQPFPTFYGENKTPVTVDVEEAGFILATLILAASFLIALPGVRGAKARIVSISRTFFGLFITSSILLVNIGQEWETAELATVTPYRAGLREEIHADIAVHIGLRSVNITLKTNPEVHEFKTAKVNETINYNERFHWDNLGFTQGRLGFGPFASTINQDYRDAQLRGVPLPILWIAEYFTLDGEGVRWGRFYRNAGYFTHVFIWLAFPMWILSMLLFYLFLPYGGFFAIGTGVCLLISNILYAEIRNPADLQIPFEDGVLTFHWGWCFYLCLVVGIICVLLGLAVSLLFQFYPEEMLSLFGNDVNQNKEQRYPEERLIEVEVDSGTAGPSTCKGRRVPMPRPDDDDYDSELEHYDDDIDTAAPPPLPPVLVARLPTYKDRRRQKATNNNVAASNGILYKKKDKKKGLPPPPSSKEVHQATNKAFSTELTTNDIRLETTARNTKPVQPVKPQQQQTIQLPKSNRRGSVSSDEDQREYQNPPDEPQPRKPALPPRRAGKSIKLPGSFQRYFPQRRAVKKTK